jgi:hypothetical protein
MLVCNLARIPIEVPRAAAPPRRRASRPPPPSRYASGAPLSYSTRSCGTGSILVAATLLACAATDDGRRLRCCSARGASRVGDGDGNGGSSSSDSRRECVAGDLEAASGWAVPSNFERVGLAGAGVSVRALRADVTACGSDLARHNRRR